MMHILLSVCRRLCDVTYAIGALTIGLMMLHVTAHVFFQYAFSFPLPGTYLFVSNYYMVAVTFLCLAAVEMKDGHVSVDILYARLSGRWQKLFMAVSQSITAAVFALLAWQGLIVAQSRQAAGSFEIEYGIRILIWPSYYLVPLGAALFVLISVVKLIALIADVPVDPDAPPAPLSQ